MDPCIHVLETIMLCYAKQAGFCAPAAPIECRASCHGMSNHVKSSQVKSSQVKSSQVKSSQVKSRQVKSSQVKSSQVKSSQVKSSRVKSSQIKSSQVRSGQVKSSQVTSRRQVISFGAVGIWLCSVSYHLVSCLRCHVGSRHACRVVEGAAAALRSNMPLKLPQISPRPGAYKHTNHALPPHTRTHTVTVLPSLSVYPPTCFHLASYVGLFAGHNRCFRGKPFL